MRRIVVLLSAAALLAVTAVPVSAAPGGVPGPPANKENAVDHEKPEKDKKAEGETNGPPDWANAYGLRIQEEFGMPFGQLQQCAGVVGAEEGEEEGEKAFLDLCPGDVEFPEGETGASAFWVFYTESGLPVVAT